MDWLKEQNKLKEHKTAQRKRLKKKRIMKNVGKSRVTGARLPHF